MAADASILSRLATHRVVGDVPHSELEWVAARSRLERYETGDVLTRPGELVEFGTAFVLFGRVSHRVEHGGVWRKVIEWRDGDVMGNLPYSRMTAAPGSTVVDAVTEVALLPFEFLRELPRECPTVAARLVHVMLDRARTFKSSDLQVEKMASLGKLAAGLAHELNNPAAAAARSATTLADALAESDRASRALGHAGLTPDESAALDALHQQCMTAGATTVLSPLERSDRVEQLSDWLDRHGLDETPAAALADAGVTAAALDELAGAVARERLGPAVRWVASGCTTRGLVRDISRAASRVHELVKAVKGFTYMDHAAAPEPLDLRRGLTDTIAVLGSKARSRSASLTVDVPADLPRVRGFGGELNQVWVNLIDNALDAIGDGGRVEVTARAEGPSIVVRVIDNGPGIAPELQQRIFDPFFTTKAVGQGTGLGLDIVRRLVERNDALIDLESRPGRTEFRVTLPITDGVTAA